MSRRTFPLANMDDFDYRKQALYEEVLDFQGGDKYVSCELDDDEPSDFEALLWREIRVIAKKARLTPWQSTCWQWHLRKFSNTEIAYVFGCDESTIRDTLDRVYQKVPQINHRGLITVMIEELGWEQVREYLADETDRRTREHADTRKSRALAMEMGLIKKRRD